MITLLFIGVLLLLVLVGSPLFVLMGAGTALAYLFYVPDQSTLEMIEDMENLLDREEFLAIPLFVLSGAIMNAGGIAKRLVEFFRAALGWLPGGLAIAAVMSCMYFASISGSSVVTLIAVGSIMFPALVESKYPENFSLGVVMTAGSLGCLVPPSLSMLIYAISITGGEAAVSPEDMFVAGLIPALLIVVLLSLYCFWVGLKVPSREKFDAGRLKRAALDGFWALLLPLVVLGGIIGGLYTPSRAGAVAVAYSLVVCIGIYRELSLKKLIDTMVESATLMGTLILIIVLAFGLNRVMVYTEIDQKLMALIQWLELGPFGFMLLVNVMLIVLGALMDSISATLIFAPLLAPIAYKAYGIDPLHFGVVFVVNMEIGYLAPPVATNLFVASALFKKPFGQVTRAIFPTLGITCVALIIVMYVPSLAKGPLNVLAGKPFYEPFPWDGRPKVEQPVLADDEAEVVAPPPTETTKAQDEMQKAKDEAMKAAFDDEEEVDAGAGTGADAGP